MDININDVQHEPIVVSASLTAALNRYYVNVASSTYTDPSPVEGEGFIVFVRNGTATVGGVGYSTAGTLIYRYFHSGAWASYEKNTEIVVQTAAQWANDATVYSAKRILITSDEYYAGGSTRKIKIADGTSIWNSLVYLLEEMDSVLVAGDLTLTGSFISPSGSTISLTGDTDDLVVGSEVLINLDANGNYNLTGIDGGVDGAVKLLYNDDTTNIITLKNFTTSTVGNRFDFYPAADFVLNPKQLVFLYYTSNRWRLLSAATSGSSGSSGSGSLNNLTYSGNYRPHKNIIVAALNSTTGYSGIVVYQKITPAIDMTVTALCAVCTTGSASQNCRMALYTSTTGVGQLPDALISGTDTGNLDCTSTGLKEGAITATALSANTDYWIFFEVSGAGVGFRNTQIAEMDIFNTSDNLYYSNIRKGASFGAPPSSAGSGFSYSTPNSAYNILHYLKIQ